MSPVTSGSRFVARGWHCFALCLSGANPLVRQALAVAGLPVAKVNTIAEALAELTPWDQQTIVAQRRQKFIDMGRAA